MSEPAVARLIGEGVERPEASLPLDINYAKLTEWLVTRQKIPKDWHKRLQVIQAKATEALKEVPSELLGVLSDGPDASVDYLRAVEIRDKLAERAERTMFGGLSGAAATWDKIVKAYEKQYVYLGECGQALVQAVDFDIPALRRQAARLGQQMQDCDRKHAECLRNAATCAAKYKEECKKLGIQGVSVRQELRALAGELPAMLRGVVDCLHDPALQSAAEYYSAFARFAHAPREARSAPASASASASASLEPVDMLPTLFEIRHRQVQPPETEAGAAEAESAAQGLGTAGCIDIDWDISAGAQGDGAAAAGQEGGGGVVDIDWDIALGGDDAGGGGEAGGGGGGGGIDWDVDVSGPEPALDGDGGAGASGAGAAPITIDWDIAVDAAGDAAATAGGDAAAGPASVEPESAAGEAGRSGVAGRSSEPDDIAASRLERDGEYRARLVDDLLELRAFLAMRKVELGGSGSELLSTALPESVSSVDGSAVAGMLGAVGRALSQLSSPRFRQLLLIATSKRYLDRLEASLQRQAGAEAKLLRAADDTAARRREAAASLAALGPRTAAAVARTRRLKALAERGVAATLGGKRSVNVLGEINNVLAAT